MYCKWKYKAALKTAYVCLNSTHSVCDKIDDMIENLTIVCEEKQYTFLFFSVMAAGLSLVTLVTCVPTVRGLARRLSGRDT